MSGYQIDIKARIARFEEIRGMPASDQNREFLHLMDEAENAAYEQGKAEALAATRDGITRLPAPFNCIMRVILTDGTIYDNVILEESAPILTGDELSAAAGYDQERWSADYAARMDANGE